MTFHQVALPASQMWILSAVLLPLFFPVSPTVCLSTEKDPVCFISRNFNNTLHWISAEPATPGENITFKYSVIYAIHGEEYKRKAGCQNITALFCDLTDVTPAIPDVYYWARVFVNDELHGSTTRFSPLTETIFGPPTLSTEAMGSNLHVHATLPLLPNGSSIGDVMTRSNNWSYKPSVYYILEITDPKWAAQIKTNTTGQFILTLKNNNTLYCGHVRYRPKPGSKLSEEAKFCIQLSADPLDLLPWLLIPAVFLLALLIISFVCACKYTKVDNNVSVPSGLIISKTPTKVLLPQNEIISISKLTVYPQKAKIDGGYCTKIDGGYCTQDILCQIWEDSSVDTAAPEDSSSSVSYSGVVVQEPTKGQGAFADSRLNNKLAFPGVECAGDHGPTSLMASHTGSSSSVSGCLDSVPSRPLLLHTVRDSDGNLVMPCPFQFQSSTADPQRRPLLSDLLDSKMDRPSSLNSDDTEFSECDATMPTPTQMYCNSDYLQFHGGIPNVHQENGNSSSTDGISESCYKQNWIPEVSVETVSMHSDCDTRTNVYARTWAGLKNEEDELEEDRELERFQLSEPFLGHWVIQIQD